MRSSVFGLMAIVLVALSATSASAGADPALTCHLGKLKIASKYDSCRLSAEAKAVKAGDAPDYGKCDEQFSTAWGKAEDKAGTGVCVTEADEAAVAQRITFHADAIATQLSGGVPVDHYVPATGQTTSYGTGDDGDAEAGATLAYRDNGDGTITDLNTGLMWEKKIQQDGGAGVAVQCSATEAGSCANPHDADNVYSWSDATGYNGGVVTIFLNQLNNRCDNDTTVACTVDADCSGPGGPCGFAGHRDWRLSSAKELNGILDYEHNGPAVGAAFNGASCGPLCTDITDPACSCMKPDRHWSSTTYHPDPTKAWSLGFGDGNMNPLVKTGGWYAIAVRGGS